MLIQFYRLILNFLFMKKFYFVLLISLSSLFTVNYSFAQCKANFLIIKDSAVNNNPYAYLFYDESTGANIYSWEWDFGDSTHSSQQIPLHNYAKAGSYVVCLTIKTGSAGNTTCTNKYCKEFTIDSILPAYCSASFYYYSLSG